MSDTISIKATRFGDLDVDADKAIEFPEGILGFEESRRYVMLDHDEAGVFKWIQSVDDASIAFLLTNPIFFNPDYKLPEKALPIDSIELKEPDDMAIMVMVCFTEENSGAFSLNLKAPIIFNAKKRAAVQYIIDSDAYACDFLVKLEAPKDDAKKEDVKESTGVSNGG